MRWLVRLVTPPGALVLDPFAGSGTTGIAALRTGRRVILVEREERWARLSRERLAAEDQLSTVAARRASQVPLFR
jgi:site-specific DNA-methyltransferase (adenine-specific)